MYIFVAGAYRGGIILFFKYLQFGKSVKITSRLVDLNDFKLDFKNAFVD